MRLEAFQLVVPDPAWQFLKVIDEFTIFRASIRDGTLSDPETIISTALRYDGELMRIFSNVPPDWLYETVYTDNDPESVWNGCYDIYYDHWVAQIWNGMRAARIMLNETVRARLLQGFSSIPAKFTSPEYTAQFQLSTEVLVKMRDGILRSVPQHTGYVKRKPFTYPTENDPRSRTSTTPFDGTLFTDLLEGATSLSRQGSSHIPPAHRTTPPRASPTPSVPLNTSPTRASSPPTTAHTPAIGGYFLLWPLYTAGVTRVSTPETHTFILRILLYIGNTMGIMQAIGLATFLSMGAAMQGEGMKLLKNPAAPAGIEQLRATMAMGGISKGGDIERELMEEEDVGGVRLGRTLDS